MAGTPTERYIQAFVDTAREQLRAHTWDAIEPALAASWEELREPDTPGWWDVAQVVRDRATAANGSDNRAA